MQQSPLETTPAAFWSAADSAIAAFPGSELCRLADSRSAQRRDYHAILATLFHQTRSSPYTFAAAAANCPWKHGRIKEYLLRHAEEKRSHWRWIQNDLHSTGYTGSDLTLVHPHPTCAAYIAFNEHVAVQASYAGLGIACVLESIGAGFGGHYGALLLQTLGLGRANATFFLSHGETDKLHSQELREVIGSADFSPQEWGWMAHAAAVAGRLYFGMYDHDGFCRQE